MSNWSKPLVLVLAFAVMPLQGLAATPAMLLCHCDAQTSGTHRRGSGDEHGAADAGHDHPHPAAAGNHVDESTGNSAYHLCCNLTASAPPTAMVPGALPDCPAQAFSPA